MYEPKRKGGIKLYAKRVFIMEDNENLMPLYLRFIKGVIDTADLPLNVSREILQDSKVVDSIKKASVSRILKDLEKMAKNKPEDYAKFWEQFGMVLKEGIVEDFANKDKIAKLLRFATNKSENATQTATLDCYVKNMTENQEDIYYITADSYEAAKNSPHLEIFNKKGIEVLLLTDKVDEWLVSNFTEFEGKKLKSVAKGDIDNLDSEDEKKAKEKQSKDFKDVIKKAKEALEDRVKDVKISNRLSDSAAVIVADENDMGGNMERIMKSLGQDVPETKPILELNPEHKLVKKLKTKMDNDILDILFDQAVLAEGGQIKNPADFVKKVNNLIG
jgi:molecular chaperone HtpG